jgi:hypothetical protein
MVVCPRVASLVMVDGHGGSAENEPMRLFQIPISFSISYLYMHMFK